MTDHTTTRRAVLTAAATLPALALPAGAETDDPAIAAVRRWVAARDAESIYRTPEGVDWDDDPIATEISAEFDRAYWAMAETRPTTAAGFGMMLFAVLWGHASTTCDARLDDPDSWEGIGGMWGDGRDAELLRTARFSPVGAELLRRITS